MKGRITTILLVFLLVATMASALEQRRSDTFGIGDTKLYKFLDRNYTVRVMNIIPQGSGQVELLINDDRNEFTGDVPFFYGPMRVDIDEISQYEVRLNFTWTREDEPPHVKTYVSLNLKKDIEHLGKIFTIHLTDINSVYNTATFTVNDEELNIAEGTKGTLKDGTIVKVNSLLKTAAKKAELHLWIAEGAGKEKIDETYDYSLRIGENEQKLINVKGVMLDVKIEKITKEGIVNLTVDNEKIGFEDGDELELGNGVVIMVSQVSAKAPRSAILNFNVPEGLEDQITIVDRTLSWRQKDTFEAEKQEIVTRFLTFNKTEGAAVIEVNGIELEMSPEDNDAEVDGIKVLMKNLNLNVQPEKILLRYFVPKYKVPEPAPKPEPEPEEEVVEDEEIEEDEPDQGTEETVEETEEVEETVEEETEEEVIEVKIEPKPQGSLGKTVKSFFSKIGEFFTWLF
ncbi:hypothetical protein ACFL1B_03935 [Nanoarchaeota archaeon]